MKKTSNEAHYSLFCKWQESGQAKVVFAASEGIPKATFYYYWCNKFDSESVSPASRSPFSIYSDESYHGKSGSPDQLSVGDLCGAVWGRGLSYRA